MSDAPILAGRISCWSRALARLLLAGMLAILVLSALLRVFDFDQLPDQGEGTLLTMIERMRREPISRRWLEGPELTLSPYGPAYYWIVEGASTVMPWRQTVIPGRLVSLAATLLTAALIALVIGRAARNVEPALLGAIAFLAAPPVHTWGMMHRVDSLAMLCALGTYLWLGGRGEPGRRLEAATDAAAGGGKIEPHTSAAWLLAGSAVCAALGSLAKQTVAFSAIPVVLYLFGQRRFRAAVLYALAVGGLGAIAWWTLDRLSGGYYFAGAVRGNICRMSLRHGFWAGHAFLATPLGVAAAAVVLGQFVRGPGRAIRSVYWIAWITSTLIATGLSCKEGSTSSYFLESCALGAVLLGVDLLAPFWSLHRGRALAAGLLLAAALAAPDVQLIRRHGLRFPVEPYGGKLIAQHLAGAGNGYVLSDGQHLAAVLQAGCRPLVNDPFLYRVMVQSGVLSPRIMLDAIEQGRVKYLVLKRTVESHRAQVGTSMSQIWPLAVVEVFARDYVLDATPAEGIFIYRHR
jgi:hypothetical protein